MNKTVFLDNKDYYYKVYYKKKKSGKIRTIYAPNDLLKDIQKDFSNYFYSLNKDFFDKRNYITGFIPGRSLIDNARPHLNKDWVITLDIKSFFPNTKKEEIKKIIKSIPVQNNIYNLFVLNKKQSLET